MNSSSAQSSPFRERSSEQYKWIFSSMLGNLGFLSRGFLDYFLVIEQRETSTSKLGRDPCGPRGGLKTPLRHSFTWPLGAGLFLLFLFQPVATVWAGSNADELSRAINSGNRTHPTLQKLKRYLSLKEIKAPEVIVRPIEVPEFYRSTDVLDFPAPKEVPKPEEILFPPVFVESPLPVPKPIPVPPPTQEDLASQRIEPPEVCDLPSNFKISLELIVNAESRSLEPLESKEAFIRKHFKELSEKIQEECLRQLEAYHDQLTQFHESLSDRKLYESYQASQNRIAAYQLFQSELTDYEAYRLQKAKYENYLKDLDLFLRNEEATYFYKKYLQDLELYEKIQSIIHQPIQPTAQTVPQKRGAQIEELYLELKKSRIDYLKKVSTHQTFLAKLKRFKELSEEVHQGFELNGIRYLLKNFRISANQKCFCRSSADDGDPVSVLNQIRLSELAFKLAPERAGELEFLEDDRGVIRVQWSQKMGRSSLHPTAQAWFDLVPVAEHQ